MLYVAAHWFYPVLWRSWQAKKKSRKILAKDDDVLFFCLVLYSFLFNLLSFPFLFFPFLSFPALSFPLLLCSALLCSTFWIYFMWCIFIELQVRGRCVDGNRCRCPARIWRYDLIWYDMIWFDTIRFGLTICYNNITAIQFNKCNIEEW